jgi:hypothetical protein
METLTVDVRRVDADSESAQTGYGPAVSELDADLARARWLANLLDAQFNFMGVSFGLDAIVGLIPVVGDAVTSIAALYPVHLAKKHNLGKTVQMRMAFNVLMDFAAGAVPVVGDLVDVAYKANLKNLKLLEKAAEKRRQSR